jgi:hypothetical protein
MRTQSVVLRGFVFSCFNRFATKVQKENEVGVLGGDRTEKNAAPAGRCINSIT